MSIIVGTVTTDIEASTTTDTNGAYSFTVTTGTIDGTVYGVASISGSDIESIPVHLLKAQGVDEYAVMVEDPGYWGTRIQPYPLLAAPFTEDFSMGYAVRIRLRVNGTYTDGEGVTLMFDLSVDESPVSHEFLWANAEGARVEDQGGGIFVPRSVRNWVCETFTVDGQAGWVCRSEPIIENLWQGLIVPRGHGAQTQRGTDYRDDSAETQNAGLPWRVTKCTAWYKGASVDVPLDGTTVILDYDPPSLTVTGCPAGADLWMRGRTGHQVPNGAIEEIIFTATADGGGEALFDEVWPGRYYVCGFIANGTNQTAGVETLDLAWGQAGTLDMTGKFADAFDAITGQYIGVWEPIERTAGATIYSEVRDLDGPPEDYYVRVVGTVAGNGLGPVVDDYPDGGPCFVDIPTFGYGRSGPEANLEPVNYVGAHGVVYTQKAYKEFGTIDNEFFRDVPNPDPVGLRVKPAVGSTVPSEFQDVLLAADDLAPSRLRTTSGTGDVPLPAHEYAGTVVGAPELDPEEVAEITWELQDEIGTVLESFSMPGMDPLGWPGEVGSSPEPHVVNKMFDIVVGARIKGGAALWSTSILDDTAPRESWPELGLELEFGEISDGPMLVMPLPAGDVTPGKRYGCGWTHITCPYCGNATDWDNALGEDRFQCAHCLTAGSSEISGRGHFATAPIGGAATTAHEDSPTGWQMRLMRVFARTLTYEAVTWDAHYRPECYWEDDDHQDQYQQLLPWQAHHIGIDTGITAGMGSWTPSGGFVSGYSCNSWATLEGQTDRVIGPVQPKMIPTALFTQAVQVRIEAKRDDDSLIYYYGTIPALSTLNEPIRFSQVMRDPPNGDIVAMATVYGGDGDASPWTASDVIVEITNAWALDPASGTYELMVSSLGGGTVSFRNDNPSIRFASVRTQRAQWTHYLAHLLVTQVWRTDIDIDWGGGFVHRVGVDTTGRLFAQRLARPYEDNVWRSTDTMAGDERTVLDSATNCGEPKIECVGDGTFRVVYMRGTSTIRAYSTDGLQSLTEQ